METPNNATTETQEIEVPKATPVLIRILRLIGWLLLGLICLSLFTLIKLPQARVKSLIEGSISAALAPKGISFTAEKAGVSLGFGLYYKMENVVVTFPPPAPQAKIEKIEVSPSILPLLLGRKGGRFWVTNAGGKMNGSFSMQGPEVSLSFNAKELDLGKLGVLPIAAGMQGSALISGEASLSGNLSSPAESNGAVDLQLSKIVFEQQNISGFNIPRLSVSEGRVEASIQKGKVGIKTFQLGKPGSADDLIATLTGDMTLGKQWASSTLNLHANFRLSQKIISSLILIDALLGAGKQADGSYSYDLTGGLYSPTPVPKKAQ